MFYSHEVLTSRRYGVATVWLVATLGSKSSLKKVSRKAILDVDVSKACETIVKPDAPMALRLQSNLLYGVSRVYQQQCGYVLSDAEAAHHSMIAMFKTLRQADLEPEGGTKGRIDQLILPDDPNFLPDFDLLPADLNAMQLDEDTQFLETQQSLLSPHSSQFLSGSQVSIGSLKIPHSRSSLLGGPVGGADIFGIRDSSGRASRVEPLRLLDDDLGMAIDADGNMHFDDQPVRQPPGPIDRGEPTGFLSGGVRSDGIIEPAADDGFMVQPADFGVSSDQAVAQPPGNAATGQSQHETSSEAANAPLRRRNRGARKAMPLDMTTQLRNSDLARWGQEYLETMRAESKHKQSSKLSVLAKRNAEFWMLNSFLGEGMRGPLDIFTGAKLLEAFSGVNSLGQGEKRAREDDDSSESGRRVRSRGEPSSGEVGRGIQDDLDMQLQMDDTIEQGREAPTPLEELQMSSMFPWNQSASSRRPTDPLHQRSASLGQQQLGRPNRQGSRLVSASPLIGRGAMADLELDAQPLDFDLPMDTMTGDDFEMYGAAANVDTQTADQSQWQNDTLIGESANFRDFVQTAIEEADEVRKHAAPGDEDDERLMGSIDFEALLPPADNTHIVAAQAMLHVLSLGTRNLLKVEQEDAFGPLTLRMVTA